MRNPFCHARQESGRTADRYTLGVIAHEMLTGARPPSAASFGRFASYRYMRRKRIALLAPA